MFLKVQDLYDVFEAHELEILSRTDPTLVDRKLAQAEEELKEFLSGRYNVTQLLVTQQGTWSTESEIRHPALVQLGAHIAAYHLVARIRGMQTDDFISRYKMATDRLRELSVGKRSNDLPLADRTDTEPQSCVLRGGRKRSNHFMD